MDKGQPLLEKAGAETDFSYVPRHSGKFQRYHCIALHCIVQGNGSNPQNSFLNVLGVQKRSVFSLGLNPFWCHNMFSIIDLCLLLDLWYLIKLFAVGGLFGDMGDLGGL